MVTSTMYAPLDDHPADLYERRLAARQAAAKRSIKRCAKWWAAGQVAVAATVGLLIGCIVAAFGNEEALSHLALLGAVLTGLFAAYSSTVPACRAAFVAIRDRSVLSWPWITFGLVPWFGLSTWALFFFAGWFF